MPIIETSRCILSLNIALVLKKHFIYPLVQSSALRVKENKLALKQPFISACFPPSRLLSISEKNWFILKQHFGVLPSLPSAFVSEEDLIYSTRRLDLVFLPAASFSERTDQLKKPPIYMNLLPQTRKQMRIWMPLCVRWSLGRRFYMHTPLSKFLGIEGTILNWIRPA